jgi:hypothetical protein
MKKEILTLAIFASLTSGILTSCKSSAEKVEDAEKNVTEANNDLNQANEEYITDIENYRIETAGKISANNQSIADFNTRIANEKKEAKEDYKKRIAELEQKNTDMKKKMDDYKATGKENWENFKAEFSHDMEELGKGFSDLTKNNVK